MLVAEGDDAASSMRNLNKVKLAIYSILLSNACLPQQQTALPPTPTGYPAGAKVLLCFYLHKNTGSIPYSAIRVDWLMPLHSGGEATPSGTTYGGGLCVYIHNCAQIMS